MAALVTIDDAIQEFIDATNQLSVDSTPLDTAPTDELNTAIVDGFKYHLKSNGFALPGTTLELSQFRTMGNSGDKKAFGKIPGQSVSGLLPIDGELVRSSIVGVDSSCMGGCIWY